ncbi:hypothetical protein HELRODRAFT_155821 [Helobdella robusta]|uniref:Mitochondrial fission process protein 1 n=1 Tax=Helobdella robusta TaxID=6412 RepID=T1ELM7_HELRO|nr:hypothetical protein HELRODRAFT_155821 [Helobdella robusta]ESO02423.1 hypothetical protein HELRODRAFT_155821 [Helobdella robusta]
MRWPTLKTKNNQRRSTSSEIRYSNEVGESFRALVHVNWVRFSYVVASTYVCADAASKGKEVYQKTQGEDDQKKKTGIVVGDVLLWQGLASVIIPGFTINRICFASNKVLYKLTKLPPMTRKWTVTAIGLGSIPFIIHPIDKFVDYLLDNTLRKYTKSVEE